jgi:Asp-tRNA(Asn)/Glu-tRNA(Gln) amidotransferase A subunit family amidase
MSEAVRRRDVSPVELVRGRLALVDLLEPQLQAWETVDRDGALAQAALAEEAVSRGDMVGPLHGVPVGIKDIIATAGLRTTMSSRIFRNNVPVQDAAVVARLKGAGAIVLGKTVSTEFAMADPPRTRNPWDFARTPGGSSSGSAVAVACGECSLALGTQTAGSVIRPAAYNGVTGFKPTYGMVSRRGVFPVSWTLDTVGWMVRTVTDAALVLDVLAGPDPADAGSHGGAYSPVTPTVVESRDAPRLGVVSGDFERNSSVEMQAHMFELIEMLRQGGNYVELFDLPISYIAIRDAQLLIDYTETASVHRGMFAERPEDYGPHVRARIECGELIPATAYLGAQRLRRQFRSDMDAAMATVDALIMPAAPAPAPADLTTTGDPGFYSPWSMAGLPAITVPTGLSRSGMPLGVQMVGRGFDDAGLLRAARWVEERAGYEPTVPHEAKKLLASGT